MILLISPKKKYTTHRLMEEAQNQKVSIDLMDTGDLAAKNFKLVVEKYELLFVRFFDIKYASEIVVLAQQFKKAGKPVLGNVLDKNLGKLKSSQILEKAGLPIPKTLPFRQRKDLDFPMVLKTHHGLGAKEVFFVNDEKQLQKNAQRYPSKDLLVQQFISAEFEYKIITVGYKSLPFVIKLPMSKTLRPDFEKVEILNTTLSFAKASARKPADAATPIVGGETAGLQLQHSPPNRGPHLSPGENGVINKEEYLAQLGKVVKLSESASKFLHRDLAKIDILESQRKFYILEVNRWPGLEYLEKVSKFNIAKEFIVYIKDLLK